MGSVQIGHVVMRATLIHHDKWVSLETTNDDPVIARGGETVRNYLQRKLADPARATRVALMRKDVGQALAGQRGGRETLATLRMNAGLSQAALAQKIGTQQPNIARWERSPVSMQFDSITKLAAALGVSVATVASVMEAQVGADSQQTVGTDIHG